MTDNLIPLVVGEIMALSDKALCDYLRMEISIFHPDYDKTIDDLINVALIGNYYDVYAYGEQCGFGGSPAVIAKVLLSRNLDLAIDALAACTNRSKSTIVRRFKAKEAYYD